MDIEETQTARRVLRELLWHMETLQPTCPRYRIWLQALAAGAPLASIGERVLAMEDSQSPLYFYFKSFASQGDSMGAAMILVCDFPGCHVMERQEKRESGKLSMPSNWMIFEAAWLSYERFAFCPEHGKAIRQQHDANQESWHASHQ